MNPEEDITNIIMYKGNRNFLMQFLVTSCKKMKVYHVGDSQNREMILDKKYGGSPDEGVKNTIAYGNMVVKEIIDMGTVIRTCIQLYKKDKDHQYMFLKQVKALMKEALDSM